LHFDRLIGGTGAKSWVAGPSPAMTQKDATAIAHQQATAVTQKEATAVTQ
jgi:hypothetical protein